MASARAAPFGLRQAAGKASCLCSKDSKYPAHFPSCCDSLSGFVGHWRPCCLCDYSSYKSIALPARSLTFPEAPHKSPPCFCLLASLCPGFFSTPMPRFSITSLEASLVTAVTAAGLPGVRSSRRLLPGVQAPPPRQHRAAPRGTGDVLP